MDQTTTTIAATAPWPLLGAAFSVLLLTLFVVVYMARCYKRCPSNQVLVIQGHIPAEKASRCLHGGGAFVFPILQQAGYLSLEPLIVELQAVKAHTKDNAPVNFSATYTTAIPTGSDRLDTAAERLLGMTQDQIAEQARQIILGQMRQAMASVTIDDVHHDRELVAQRINQCVDEGLAKIGLDLVSFNLISLAFESVHATNSA